MCYQNCKYWILRRKKVDNHILYSPYCLKEERFVNTEDVPVEPEGIVTPFWCPVRYGRE